MANDPNTIDVIISNHQYRLESALETQKARYPKEALDTGELIECLLEDIMHLCDDKELSFDNRVLLAKKSYKKHKTMMAKNA